jgi:multidrug efflux pump subunit AcrB
MQSRGTIAWFARNPVAANLVMFMLLIGGIVVGTGVRQEVFPDFRLDVIGISVPYPGASPSEVEQGILLAVEEAVRGIDGVERVSSAATEGVGTTYVSLELDADGSRVLPDVKNAIDRLSSLPKEAERPTVSLVTNRVEVISLVLYGEQDRAVLRAVAERTREELLADPGITQVDLTGAPPREIAIEVSRSALRTHGLTIEDIAARVRGAALELPGGSVKTESGEVLLRTTERRFEAMEFADIPVVTSATGTDVTLDQIAAIGEGFENTDESSYYQGKPAIMIKVFRTGDQTPIEVADRVEEHVQRLRMTLPEGIEVATWMDWSEIYEQRIDLLLRNAYIGLTLVLLILGLFLELRLAFWVTMGIPVSFLGALMLMPAMDVSVNMISLFAFIVTLGMVVDDAIVVGENIYEERLRGAQPLEAAINGAKRVAVPVCFSIATSVVAFMPMLFVPGFSGKLYRVIPSIVIAVLVISLVESLWVLPAHLAALREPRSRGLYAVLHRQQQRVARTLERFIHKVYAPALAATLRQRFVASAVGLAILIAAAGWVGGGHIGFRFMPEIDGDLVIASVELPHGTSVEQTRRVQQHMMQAAVDLLEESGEHDIVRGMFSQIGAPLPGDPGIPQVATGGGHLANVQVFFVPADDRRMTTASFMQAWRERVGRVAQAERLDFMASIGPSPGAPIDVELLHDDMDVLERASSQLAEAMRDYAGVWDIDDGFAHGKPQLDLRLTPEAKSLGLTAADLAGQVRGAFHGTEALRQQRGRDEVKVVVRLPEQERRTVHDVESLLVRTPGGGEIPLSEAATIAPGRAWPVIRRSNGRRMVEVTADVRPDVANPGTILEAIEQGPLAQLVAEHPGLAYEFGGSAREQGKAMGSLAIGGQLALVAVFALLAIPFRSYVQPVIVMAAIPFGVVGAILGHIVMGFELSMISVMGLIALSGVVVNDSLVLIAAANDFRTEGASAFDAIHAAGVRRFRPILLTSLTTFFGLTPMILETSVQAQFLIPMAISLGFGILFATFIILLLVPVFYLFVDDLTRGRPAKTPSP